MIGDSGLTRVQALTDGDDRLLGADDPLISLQLWSGGTIPGAIAIPELAEAVRQARRLGMRLARSFAARDGQNLIRAWAYVGPRDDGEAGCAIALRHWHAVPFAPEDPDIGLDHRARIDQALADLAMRLDNRQCLLSVERHAPDLHELVSTMQCGLGRPWTDFVMLPDIDRLALMDWQRLNGAVARVPGSPRTWRVSLVRRVDPADAPTGFDMYLIAETALGPDAMNQRDDRLSCFAGALDDQLFGQAVAPALRQPIARIIANAETIHMRLAGPLDQPYTNFAVDIATAGKHLLALVEDLTDLEEIDMANFSTMPDAIDLGDVTRRAAGILSGRAHSKRISITLPRGEAPHPAQADLRRVLQVLLNLIGNALCYAPEHTQISLELEQDGERAQVTVIDQGPGLSLDQQSRLFEKFERLGRSEDGGSGLGLYISRRLARAMGGDLTVVSAPGQGARFTLSVPGG